MNDMTWDDLRLFYHVAQSGSLAGAAERTGLSSPTIGRRMLDLERATGRTLFVRKQTGYELAPDGQVLLERVMAMRLAAKAIEDWREDVMRLPMVAISAGTWMSRFIADNLGRLWSPADPFRLCFKTAETHVDIGHREADIGLRNQRPASGNLAVRRTNHVAFAPYCALSFDQDRDCNWVALGSDVATTPSARWTLSQPNLWITTWANTPGMLYSLVRGGAGRGVLPCFIGDADPDLVRAGPVIEALSHTMWIVMHDDERNRPEVRTVIDRLVRLNADHSALFNGDCGGREDLPTANTI